MADLDGLPTTAAWTHHGARTGFEAVTISRTPEGWTLDGATTATEDSIAWNVSYRIAIDHRALTRRADIDTRSGTSRRSTRLEHDGDGHWRIDGRSAPRLDGCLDIDLEASALTNAFPVRRLLTSNARDLEPAPAAYVRVRTAHVDVLQQTYHHRFPEAGPTFLFEYSAPVFDFHCTITYDRAGLVLDYPTIATRTD